MKRLILFAAYVALVLAAGYALWPALAPHWREIKSALAAFQRYSAEFPLASYSLFMAVLALVLLIGLPVASAIMLLAGLLYGFWEAALLITVCRTAVAVSAFFLARKMIDAPPPPRNADVHHPCVALFLMRLAPIPDSVVNYGVAASYIRAREYFVVSLIGMIPFTLACVWLGSQMGNVNALLRFLLR